MQNVVILGSTGSIGENTLAVIRLHRDKYNIFALTANTQADKLITQCIEFNPKYLVLLQYHNIKELALKLTNAGCNTQILTTINDILDIVKMTDVDIVVSAIVGVAGLLPTYTACLHNKKILLANKESLVVAGKLFKQILLNNKKAQILPIDSEHNAIFQALNTNLVTTDTTNMPNIADVNKIILTGSGGPFYKFTRQQLAKVTPEMAIKHPKWKMGKKISVDSSTLMNKGLEIIEAYWLFGLDLQQIEVIIHPQSIIHSMVEYIDGSIIAQLSLPNMMIPISYALSYPKRIKLPINNLNFTDLQLMTFDQPDYDSFPCLKLAIAALNNGKASGAVLNMANEIVVEAFLHHKISFYQINQIIEIILEKFSGYDYNSIEEIISIVDEVTNSAKNLITKISAI
jgi:1-deoxy-D-xylulose-5-phosphate reductoisomerase